MLHKLMVCFKQCGMSSVSYLSSCRILNVNYITVKELDMFQFRIGKYARFRFYFWCLSITYLKVSHLVMGYSVAGASSLSHLCTTV